MDGLNVRGRMLREPRVTTTADDFFLTIRVDDASNDEFWLEVQITGPELLDMLQRVASVTVVNPKEVGDALRVLQRSWRL